MAALDRPGAVLPKGDGPDWRRNVALAVNWALGRDRQRLPYEALATAPASPVEGQTYYNTATHKVMTYDGTAWQAHW